MKTYLAIYTTLILIVFQSCNRPESGQYIVYEIDNHYLYQLSSRSTAGELENENKFEFAQFGTKLEDLEYVKDISPFFLSKTFNIDIRDDYAMITDLSNGTKTALSKDMRRKDGKLIFKNMINIGSRDYSGELVVLNNTKMVLNLKEKGYYIPFHCLLSIV